MGKGDRRSRRKKNKSKKKQRAVVSTGILDTTLGARGLNVLSDRMSVDEGGKVVEFFPGSETEPEEDLLGIAQRELEAARDALDQQRQIHKTAQANARAAQQVAQRAVSDLEDRNDALSTENDRLSGELRSMEVDLRQKRRIITDLQEANNDLASAKSQAERTAREANRSASDAKGDAARARAKAAAADARIADLEAEHARELEQLRAQVVASRAGNPGDLVIALFRDRVTGEIEQVARQWKAVCNRAAIFLRRATELTNRVEDARFRTQEAIEDVEDAAGDKVWDGRYENWDDWVEKARIARARREELQALQPEVVREVTRRDQIHAESEALQARAITLRGRLTRTLRVFMDVDIDLWEYLDLDGDSLDRLTLSIADAEEGFGVADLHRPDLGAADLIGADWFSRYDTAVKPLNDAPKSSKSKRQRHRTAETEEPAPPAAREKVVLMPGSVFINAPEHEVSRLALIALFVITSGRRSADSLSVHRALTGANLLRQADGLARTIDRALGRWSREGVLTVDTDLSGPIPIRHYSANSRTREKVEELLELVTSDAGKGLTSRIERGFCRR